MAYGLSDDIDLDRGVATRVVDVAGVDLGDGHDVCNECECQQRRSNVDKQLGIKCSGFGAQSCL